MPLLMQSCVSSPARSDACSSYSLIILDRGYETRLTADEKRQILDFDKTYSAECAR